MMRLARLPPLLLLLMLLFAACTQKTVRQPAKEGRVDLSRSGLCDGRLSQLNGHWRMFLNDLLSTADVAAALSSDAGARYLRVPSTWNRERAPGNAPMGSYGYATFALRVHLGTPHCTLDGVLPSLAVYVREAFTAYDFEVADVDGSPLSERVGSGLVGTSLQSSKPLLDKRLVKFPWRSDLILVWRISNFHHNRGGPVNPPDFGLAQPVERNMEVLNGSQLLVLGVISIIFLYNLLLFLFFPRIQAPLWLCLFCLIIAARLVVTNNYIEHFTADSSLWLTIHRMNVITVALGGMSFYLYSRSRYDFRWRRIIDYIVCGIGIGYIPFAAFLPHHIYYPALTLVHVMVAFVVLQAFYLEVRERRNVGAVERFFSSCSVLVLGGSALLEILNNYEIIYAPGFTNYGMAGYLFLEAIRIAFDNQRSHLRLESFARELEAARHRLETLLHATRNMAAVKSPLEAVEAALLALIHQLRTADISTGVLRLWRHNVGQTEAPVERLSVDIAITYGSSGEVKSIHATESAISDEERRAALEDCCNIVGHCEKRSYASGVRVTATHLDLAFLLQGRPVCLLRVCFAREHQLDNSQRLFVETLTESLAGIFAGIEHTRQEREHLLKLVTLAASISDKLNSPLTAVRNAAEKILGHVDDFSASPSVVDESLPRLKRLADIVMQSVEELQTTSYELAQLRDSADVEPTKIFSTFATRHSGHQVTG